MAEWDAYYAQWQGWESPWPSWEQAGGGWVTPWWWAAQTGGGGWSPQGCGEKGQGGQGRGGQWQKGHGQHRERRHWQPKGAGGDGPGKGKADARGGGDGKGKAAAQVGGGVSPLDGLSGEQWLTEKGKGVRRACLALRHAPAETPAAQRRQQNHAHYAAQAALARASGVVPPEPEVKSVPHQLELPWPHSHKEMGAAFMEKAKENAQERGFNLRLSGYRDEQWRKDPVKCASMYRLCFTGDPLRPDRSAAVELLWEFARAAAKEPDKPSTLPWEQIIEWWDGEDRMGSRR